jgi:hypothetical protein
MDRTVIGDKLINDAGIYPDVKGFTYIIDAVETFKPGKSTLMDVCRKARRSTQQRREMHPPCKGRQQTIRAFKQRTIYRPP